MEVLGNKINPGGQQTSIIRRHTPALGSNVFKLTALTRTHFGNKKKR